MSLIRHYVTLVVFAIGLLLGVQVPNFVDQYEKRVDAHYLEAKEDLSGFQKIADRYHHGSITALIAQHDVSADRTFRAEAGPIRGLYERERRFEKERDALRTSFAAKVLHVALDGDTAVIRETYDNYSANVPLNANAIGCGLTLAMGICLILESVMGAVGLVAHLNREARRAAAQRPA